MIHTVCNSLLVIMLAFHRGAAFVASARPNQQVSRILFSTIDAAVATNEKISHGNDNDDDSVVLDPLVVCGPSGVGKGTIIHKFMEEMGGKHRFGFTVSHTTRSPRPGEVHGVQYHFCSKERMQQDIDNGLFLEYAQVHGNYYGTSWKSLQQVQLTGKRCLLDIDVQGVKNLKAREAPPLKPKYLFIAPPSLECLEARLTGRGTESAESLARRTANAKEEMEYGQILGAFDCTIINDDLERACQDFAAAIDSMYQ